MGFAVVSVQSDAAYRASLLKRRRKDLQNNRDVLTLIVSLKNGSTTL